jgi:phage host-nuclease inhibitor protein Gam
MDSIKTIADRYAEAKTRYDLVLAELESKLTAIKNQYSEELEQLEQQIQQCADALKMFHDENNPMNHKTLGYVRFGYRVGREKVVVQDEQKLATLLLHKGYNEFVRHKVELDKSALLKKCQNDQYFADVYGIDLVKEYKFFIELL